MKKRLCSILLAIAMVFGVLPGTAQAAQAKEVVNPFTDVAGSAYYHDAVLWALDAGITTGTSASTFSPSATCTRGQVVTFLWRALGSPSHTSSANPFVDVGSGAYYYDAVLWAVEHQVTAGISATSFAPNSTCTSGQVVTFLWRANGEPNAAGGSTLAAVYPNAYYTDAVAWADGSHLLTGTGTFQPDVKSPRADIVTYLYRNAGAPEIKEAPHSTATFSLSSVPAYAGKAYVAVNGNTPYFTAADSTTTAFETYSPLDSLGRCGVAYANICKEIMPTEPRGEIGSVKPSGWQTAKYDFVDGKYLYNRCHLIGFQLAGENANTKNLITGTRYLNIEGMLPFENMIDDYVDETGNHVLYRVTPIFEGSNLVASGVLMEGWSVEDKGDGICFCVYAYNVQPGVTIRYADGSNSASGTIPSGSTDTATTPGASAGTTSDTATGATGTYILNTNTKKFHYPSCSSVSAMSNANKQSYSGSRESLISNGYSPCGRCKP